MGLKQKLERNLKPFNKTKEEKNTKKSKSFDGILEFPISIIFYGLLKLKSSPFKTVMILQVIERLPKILTLYVLLSNK